MQHPLRVRTGVSIMTRKGKIDPNFTSTNVVKYYARSFMTDVISYNLPVAGAYYLHVTKKKIEAQRS